MSQYDHDRARKIFLEACNLPVDHRAAYLEQACGGDDELRSVVLSLLRHDETGAGQSDPMRPPGDTCVPTNPTLSFTHRWWIDDVRVTDTVASPGTFGVDSKDNSSLPGLPPDDVDLDGILDVCDNCPGIANGECQGCCRMS